MYSALDLIQLTLLQLARLAFGAQGRFTLEIWIGRWRYKRSLIVVLHHIDSSGILGFRFAIFIWDLLVREKK